MTALVAIDPGYAEAGKGCACAAFVDGRLVEVWFERPVTFKAAPEPRPRTHVVRGAFDLVLIEALGERGPGDGVKVGTLVKLAWNGALLAGSFAGRDQCPIVALTPKEWKGSEPKPAHHWRLWAALDASERKVLGGTCTERAIAAAREKGALSRWSRPGAAYYPRAFDTHNLLDAAALGATYLGRLAKLG